MVTTLCQHNDLIAAFIYDPLECDMPDAGRTVIAEGDLQLEINTSSSALRRKFRQQFEDRLQRVRQFSRERSIPLLPIHTGEGVAEQIRSLLGNAPRTGDR